MLCYPLVVGYSLLQGQLLWGSVLLIALAVLRFWDRSQLLLWPLTGIALFCGGLSLCFPQQAWLKLYPVLMNIAALSIFAITLCKPPSMIERFARILQPDLPETGVIWTRQVTKVWCVFFLLNGAIAYYTVYWCSTQIWVLYNGLIAYLLMGILLLSEYILRRRQQRRHALSDE
ncbi:COG4648 family protein [Acinetobacter larvae]|uniref:Clp protease n=1 Tax=Acinetobacter larvae TaxID=1789224 RepID=A0A1B2M2P6_9GAMM|nr:septation protein IspZ [Acinetobacter larvae]AOA59293.1 Clp protease [Acinetobacter larvae]